MTQAMIRLIPRKDTDYFYIRQEKTDIKKIVEKYKEKCRKTSPQVAHSELVKLCPERAYMVYRIIPLLRPERGL